MVKVKLNDKASIFFDPTTNIIVKKGDVVELNGIQYSSKKIRSAINGRHLVLVKEDKAKKEPVKENIVEKFKSIVDGSDIKTLKKQFTLDQLKEIANSYDVEVDDSDTKDSILKAILEE